MESNNNACIVRDSYSWDVEDKNAGAYKYVSEAYKVNLEQKKYLINISIKETKSLGAFIIARYIYGMFQHVKKELNYTPPKVIIQWSQGIKGEGSQVKKFHEEYTGDDLEKIKGFIEIDGFAMD